MTSFMRHLHRRAAFFAGGMRDDLYQHFANMVLEIGIRECCQLANKSLRADWDAYPHSFLLYQEGHVQVPPVPCLRSTQGLCSHTAPCAMPTCSVGIRDLHIVMYYGAVHKDAAATTKLFPQVPALCLLQLSCAEHQEKYVTEEAAFAMAWARLVCAGWLPML